MVVVSFQKSPGFKYTAASMQLGRIRHKAKIRIATLSFILRLDARQARELLKRERQNFATFLYHGCMERTLKKSLEPSQVDRDQAKQVGICTNLGIGILIRLQVY